MSEKFEIYTDGGARGNPGPAAVGVLIKTERGDTVARISETIGTSTNNEAEYQALIKALKYLSQYSKEKKLADSSIFNFYLDSRLIVNQVNGFFKVKNSHLRENLYKVRELEGEIPGKIYYHLIPREKNYQADQLVNQALDNLILAH